MFTRTIGNVFRGASTPLQVMLACILGMALGFVPGFSQAPGLIVFLCLLLILLNTNLALVVLVTLLGKALSLLLLPASYHIGRLLLDGPTQGLFKAMINAPVLALFGFEYYVVTGGLLIGLLLGVAAGWALVGLVGAYRRKMAGVEENSDRYKTLTSRWYIRALIWIFAGGGKGKRTYADLLTRRIGNPIRPLGVVVVVLAVALLVIIRMLATGPILAAYMKDGLELANGATVDVGDIEVDLKEGRLTIFNLAMADPSALDTDLLRAVRIDANIAGADLLRRRIKLDRVLVSESTTGEKRATRGRRIGSEPFRLPDPPPMPEWSKLEEYLRTAELWKQRIEQAGDWLEKLSGLRSNAEPLKDRLERLLNSEGYARVYAAHLVEGAPTFHIAELTALKVRSAQLQDETLDVIALDLSTHPSLLESAPRITIKSSRLTLDFAAALGSASAKADRNTIRLACRNIPADAIARQLAGDPAFKGGTIDFSTDGTWDLVGRRIDLPLQVALNNVALNLPSGSPRNVPKLAFALGVAGPVSAPRIRIDPESLAKAFKDAGVAELTGQLKTQADKHLGRVTEKIPANLLEKAPSAADLLKGFGTRKESKEKQ